MLVEHFQPVNVQSRVFTAFVGVWISGVLGCAPAFAQISPEPDATALAKQSQNPVADLVSVPFQFNFNTGGGLED